ncbi:Pancreatic lipase-related protein 2 [Varanus komodoensis]|nr:Pancreatic lipase-related protein 2 [Varanus komodoensis]
MLILYTACALQLLVNVENINCIAVDWEDGAKCTYFSAASNTRVLGAVIAYLINTFTKMYLYCPSKIHLIGHSLGAHTAGEAGRRLRGTGIRFLGIDRITGLDPAAFGFEGFPDMVRLDPSDARFVDVIHTNAGRFPNIGFGFLNATGDLDFYPNGGKIMVGCDNSDTPPIERDSEDVFKEARAGGNCHHSRSHEYYRYSILYPDGFIAYPCESYESFQEGNCFPCPREGCPVMGHYADRFRTKLRKNNSTYYLNTGPKEPFTSWRYNISVRLSGIGTVEGEIYIIFRSRDGDTKGYQIESGTLNQQQIYSKVIDVAIKPPNATRIEFIWHKQSSTSFLAKMKAKRVSLMSGQDGLCFQAQFQVLVLEHNPVSCAPAFGALYPTYALLLFTKARQTKEDNIRSAPFLCLNCKQCPGTVCTMFRISKVTLPSFKEVLRNA